MEQFNKAQVIMLPTKFTHYPYIPIIDVTGNNQLSKNNNFRLTVSKFYHLYITSDDEIKEGDWCLDTINNILFISDGNIKLHKSTDKKIIATTDASLNLPLISQQFIEEYIEEYNKDNIITIKTLKDSWNRKELEFEFNKLLGDLLVTKRNKDLIRIKILIKLQFI